MPITMTLAQVTKVLLALQLVRQTPYVSSVRVQQFHMQHQGVKRHPFSARMHAFTLPSYYNETAMTQWLA
jgi:hypothetical protein